jgi:hypothetical protein
VAFLDDDDMWLPDHLSVALAGLDGDGTDMVYTTCLVAQPGRAVPGLYRFATPFSPDLLAVTNPTPVISVVARTFDPHDPMLDARGAVQEDWAMWLGLVRGRGWRIQHLDTPTAVYHRNPASMTGAAAATVAALCRFAAGTPACRSTSPPCTAPHRPIRRRPDRRAADQPPSPPRHHRRDTLADAGNGERSSRDPKSGVRRGSARRAQGCGPTPPGAGGAAGPRLGAGAGVPTWQRCHCAGCGRRDVRVAGPDCG